MMSELEILAEKLKRIEQYFATPLTEAERLAGPDPAAIIKARLKALALTDPPIEFRFTRMDPWAHRILMALLLRYGITAYRYPGQRHSTIMIRAAEPFINNTLIPIYDQSCDALDLHFQQITRDLISQAFNIEPLEPS